MDKLDEAGKIAEARTDKGGRRSVDDNAGQAKRILSEAAPDAARYLRDLGRPGTKRRPSAGKLKAAELVLNQVLGLPPRRQDTGPMGDVMSWRDVMILAHQAAIRRLAEENAPVIDILGATTVPRVASVSPSSEADDSGVAPE